MGPLVSHVICPASAILSVYSRPFVRPSLTAICPETKVLSVVGQQVMTIQQALKGDNQRIVFEGSNIIVKPGFGVFITMNPGYAGR